MNDPTKDIIPRSAVEYCLRKETVSTNPEEYKTHEKFIDYMNDPDISEFGHWMHSNGFNCALTTISVDLKKIPSVTPSAQQWIPCSERMPEPESATYWVCTDTGCQCSCRWTNHNRFWPNLLTDWHWNPFDIPQYSKVVAWMPLPEPYKGE